MATITPTWTDNVTVVASQSMSFAGTTVRGTIDLRAAFGAYLFIRLGRKGTTALTNGVDVLVRRVFNNTSVTHVGPIWAQRSQIAAAASTTVDTDAAAGAYALDTVDTTGFAAGDVVIVGAGTAREEYLRVSKNPLANVLTFDTALKFAHTAVQADAVTNKADVWGPIPVDGGAVIEVIFDYGDDSAGSDVQVECLAQTHASDTSA